MNTLSWIFLAVAIIGWVLLALGFASYKFMRKLVVALRASYTKVVQLYKEVDEERDRLADYIVQKYVDDKDRPRARRIAKPAKEPSLTPEQREAANKIYKQITGEDYESERA